MIRSLALYGLTGEVSSSDNSLYQVIIMNINGYEAIPGPSPAVWVQGGRYAVRGMQTVSPPPPSLGRGQVSNQSQCSVSDQDLLPLPWTGLERGGHTEHRTHRLRGNV